MKSKEQQQTTDSSSETPQAATNQEALDAEREQEELQRQRRRAFLKQTAVTTGVALAAGWGLLAPPRWPLSLRDPDGERGKPIEPLLQLPRIVD